MRSKGETAYLPAQAFSCAQDGRFARKVDVTREKKPSGQREKDDLRPRILELLAERPLNKVEISKSLGLPVQRRAKLRELLRDMEFSGEIARIRKDRYVVPESRIW